MDPNAKTPNPKLQLKPKPQILNLRQSARNSRLGIAARSASDAAHAEPLHGIGHEGGLGSELFGLLVCAPDLAVISQYLLIIWLELQRLRHYATEDDMVLGCFGLKNLRL